MTRGISIWLDLLRVAATLLVVFSHLAYPRFTETRYAFMREWNLGSDAVIVFFVISGFVIAHAAERDGTATRFAFNRMTRLWSVLGAALVLTIAFDTIGYRIDPDAYPTRFYQPHPIGEFLFRGLSFTNEWDVFGRLRLGTNGPLWSLSYEAAYYALFGIAIFAKGLMRWALLAVVALWAGSNVLLLMPAWVIGVLLWRWMRAENHMQLDRGVAWCLALGAPMIYVACHFAHVPELLVGTTASVLGVADARMVLGFSDEFIWNAIIGVLSAAHIAGMARVLRGELPGLAWVPWLAGASFSIYVTHYPALHLLDAALPNIAARDFLLFFGSVLIGLAFAQIFERPIKSIRRVLLSKAPKYTVLNPR